jgi:acyl-CoA hydrolase
VDIAKYTEKWSQKHRLKICQPDEAIRVVKPGDRIFVGSGAAVPQSLVGALAEQADGLYDTRLIHLLTLGFDPTANEKLSQHLRHSCFFIGPNIRDAVQACRADYIPVFLSEIPNLFKTKAIPVDVALIQVSPPDQHGFLSYGVSVDIVKSATEAATHVIAEINPRMPRSLGDSFLHLDEVDTIVWSDEPIYEPPPLPLDDISLKIGRNVASLIEDGSTLQMGIGAIPDATLACLDDKQDLGIHTEMFSDGVLRLVESGVVNNARKTLHRKKIVTSFVIGSRKLYDFVDNNPLIEFRPSQYTNDPFLIARNDKMVAINSALEVDLTGQVCADSIGHRFYSGIGGQVDFIRGAAKSKGGKPIIALPSRAKKGTISRIAVKLSEGAGVVTTRGDVHYVVTEYGIAYLHGRNVRNRALALIGIAHPEFREELLAGAKARGYLPSDQKLPQE